MHGGGTGIETYVYNQACLNGETGRLATIINNKAVEATGMTNRGVKTKDLAMVRDTRMSACLIECGFMDNANDTPLILTEEYSNKVANGIAKGILAYCNIEKKENATVGENQTVQETKSIVDLANEVIAGKYGTGEARKQALGSMYAEVQGKVNEMLGVKSTQNKKSNEEIADEVIKGLWDKGQARKDKLAQAGYDYNAIQKIVNTKLK